MAKRETKTLVKGITADQFNEALTTYAKADAKEQAITAKMDADMTRIREKYQAELDTLKSDKTDAFEVVQTYALENRDTVFSKKKSLDTVHGVIGFRTGTPKLKLATKMTWAKVLDNLKVYLPGYVRKIEEPAKDRLLIDRDTQEVAANLKKVGLLVDQDERFFIELKKEEAEPVA